MENRVRNLIALGSNRAQVGKTTLTANLGIALALQNLKVGVIDANVYKDEMSKLFGIAEGDVPRDEQKRPQPVDAHGVRIFSMNWLTPPKLGLRFHGRVVQLYLRYALEKVQWGDMDYILINLPSGTGESSHSIVDRTPINGGIVVLTPEDKALMHRWINIFTMTKTRFIGIAENMYQPEKERRKRHYDAFDITRDTAKEIDPINLGRVPMDAAIALSYRDGVPATKSAPDALGSQAIIQMAERIVHINAFFKEQSRKRRMEKHQRKVEKKQRSAEKKARAESKVQPPPDAPKE